MAADVHENSVHPVGLTRVIGRYAGDGSAVSARIQPRSASGRTVVCVAGVHGNEPAGVTALRRVFETLKSLQPPCAGRLVGLAGNLRALAERRRYIDRDLNRQWTPEIIDSLRATGPDAPLCVEQREQLELLGALEREFQDAAGAVCLMDMHTMSSTGPPFVVLSDTLRNRSFAVTFPVPIVLGIEERVGGTLPGYVCDLGHVTLGFEAGRHDDPASIDIHEAAVWIALFSAGVVDPRAVPGAARFRARLIRAVADMPRLVEMRYRHAVAPGDGFKMMDGFASFQKVTAGCALAHDKRGPIRARETSYVLLPLYQSQGRDGFFLVRPVKPAWLALSAQLRRWRVGGLAHWLPGVRRHPKERNTLLVNPRVARWFVTDLFHLLGFRRRHSENGRLVFTRRDQSPRVSR